MYVCQFSGHEYDMLSGSARYDYERVKAAVLRDGRFSVFDASATARSARLFDSLCSDKTVRTYQMGYPWVGIEVGLS